MEGYDSSTGETGVHENLEWMRSCSQRLPNKSKLLQEWCLLIKQMVKMYLLKFV